MRLGVGSLRMTSDDRLKPPLQECDITTWSIGWTRVDASGGLIYHSAPFPPVSAFS